MSIIETDQEDFVIGGYSIYSGDYRFIGSKISSEGELIWWRQYPENESGACYAVIETKDGQYLFGGYVGRPNAIRGYAVKVRDNGEILWDVVFEPEDISVIRAIREHPEQGYYFAGGQRPNEGYGGFSFANVNEGGEIIWSRSYLSDVGPGVCRSFVSAGNGYSLFGNASYTVDGQAVDDFRVVRVGLNGNAVWDRIYEYEGLQIPFCIARTLNNGCTLVGEGILSHPFILHIEPSGEPVWSRSEDIFIRGGYYSCVLDRDGFLTIAGWAINANIAPHIQGVLVQLEPYVSPPEIMEYFPEEFEFETLLSDTITFWVRAVDSQGDSLSYLWAIGNEEVSTDTAHLFEFTELGDWNIKCVVNDISLADSIQWLVHVREMYIFSHIPDSSNLLIRRNTVVPFSIDSVAYIDDGRGRPAYRWTLIDRLDDNRRAEVGQDSAAAIRFERKGRYAVEGLAYLGDSRDSVTWEVEVRGIIRAHWPAGEVVSIRPGEEVAFGVAPFEPEDRRPRLSYRWQVDQVDIVDEDSSEVRLVFPNRGRFEVGVFVTDSMQV
ncbi:MAG: hypothetical protein FJY65_09970, partial [Calditrichaeota bacterium]|nr:hypothetical protein [Calditrichota bacterium]